MSVEVYPPRLLVVTLMWRKFRTYLNLYEWFDYFRQGHLKFVLDYSGCRRSNVRPAPYGLRPASPYRKFANRKFFLKVGCKIIYKMATNIQVGILDRISRKQRLYMFEFFWNLYLRNFYSSNSIKSLSIKIGKV